MFIGDNMKIKEGKLLYDSLELSTLEVELKGTTLLLIEGYNAFFMCGALDVNIYNSPKMLERKVICGKAVGVKTIEELLNASLVQVSNYAKYIGLFEGMKVYEAFSKLSKEK